MLGESQRSQLLEDSIGGPSLTGTAPELSMSTTSLVSGGSDGERSPKSPNSKQKGKGRKKKNKSDDELDTAPKAPYYHGPPPDEEFLDEVLITVKTKPRFLAQDYLEQLHLMLREGETGIGQECNTRNIYGFTPLAVASAAGDNSLVALLLEHEADVSFASTERAELPLHIAAKYRHKVVTQLLVGPCMKLGLIDARTSTGWTPLHTCADSGDKDVFKILMSAKADLETRNPITGNEHAIHVAARASNLEIIEVLLAADADVNCEDSLSRTPLHLAADMVHADCVSLLLRSRANVHHRGGPQQLTPFECVPAEHHDEAELDTVMKLLSVYQRRDPSPVRYDVRFDLRDERDLI